jgi:hypothetical protein
MLEFCADKGIEPMVEVMKLSEVGMWVWCGCAARQARVERGGLRLAPPAALPASSVAGLFGF